VSLAQARKARDDARSLLAQGIDPNQAKQEAKAMRGASFEEVARDFNQNKVEGWSKRHADEWLSGMQAYCSHRWGANPFHPSH
jgi:hypothetical protein